MSQDFFRNTLNKLTQLNESAQIGMYETRGAHGTVDTEHYSWGDLKVIRVGHDFSIPLHPEHIEQLNQLPNHKSTTITDETNSRWLVTKENDEMSFEDRRGNSVVVPTTEICDVELDEGTWAIPDTDEKQQRLIKILSKPLLADAATHVLYNYIGDDTLFDRIDDAAEFFGREDVPMERQTVNDVVIDWMQKNVDRFPELEPVLNAVGGQMDESYWGKGNHKPGWMLKADPALGKKVRDAKRAARPPLSKPSKEQVDELSKDTLGKYARAAKDDLRNAERIYGHERAHEKNPKYQAGWQMGGEAPSEYFRKTADKRSRGIDRAVDRLTRESGDDVMAYSGPSASELNPYTAREVLQQARGWLEQGEDFGTVREIINAMVDDGAVSMSDAKRVLAKIHNEQLNEVLTPQQQQQMTAATPGVAQAQPAGVQAAGALKQTAGAAQSAATNANAAATGMQAAGQKIDAMQQPAAKSAAPMAQNKPTVGQYTIKPGDNLTKIAKANGTTVQAIMQANPQIKDANRIAAGAGLNLPQTPVPLAFKPGQQPNQPAPVAQPAAQTTQAPGMLAQAGNALKGAWNTMTAESINIGDTVRFETAPGIVSPARVVAISEGQLTVQTRWGTEYMVNEGEVKKAKKKDPADKSDMLKALRKAKKDGKLEEDKADKDYDGDGKIESEKDEVWGSRMKAAKKAGKLKESGEEVWTVTYYNERGKKESERDFPSKEAADAHAKKGNAKDKVGGKYKVTKTRGMTEAAKPDFLDLDKDGNKKEPMKKAAKKVSKMKESWDDWDDEDPDVRRADDELRRRKIELPKTKADPDADMARLARKTKPEDDQLDEADLVGLGEKAVSKKQQQFMGMVHAAQSGEKPKSAKIAKAAKSMSKQDVTDFAKTKHKGLPKRVKETTTSGAVATAMPTEQYGNEAKKMNQPKYGKGVYDLNGKVDSLINESMSINVSLSTGPDGRPTKSININATDDDAEQLSRILNLAGIDTVRPEPQVQAIAIPSDDIEIVDENMPDWPTNPETLSDTPTMSTYAGGLNKPKRTGQTTRDPHNISPERGAFNENVELERTLFKLYQSYKGGE